MLKIISPQEQHYYQARIDLLVGMMRCAQPFRLSSEEQKISTFIIGEATCQDANFLSEGDVYGGALLYERSIKDLPSSFQALILRKESVWGGIVSLFINPKKPSLEENGLDGCQLFYKELLEKLGEFGRNSKIDFLYLILSPSEYQYTKQKGLWPYTLEISPENSIDGLFHGILHFSDREIKTSSQKFSLSGHPLSSSIPRAA